MDLTKLDAQQKLDMIDWVRCGVAKDQAENPIQSISRKYAILSEFVGIMLTGEWLTEGEFKYWDYYMKKGKDMDSKKTHL